MWPERRQGKAKAKSALHQSVVLDDGYSCLAELN